MPLFVSEGNALEPGVGYEKVRETDCCLQIWRWLREGAGDSLSSKPALAMAGLNGQAARRMRRSLGA